MCDRFSDKDITNGNYREATNWALEALFSVHPMKSLRDYFDVYEVTAVSYNNTNLMALVEDSTNYNTAFNVMEIEEIGGGAVGQGCERCDAGRQIQAVHAGAGVKRVVLNGGDSVGQCEDGQTGEAV